MKIPGKEKEVGVGCGLQTFYYLETFINDLEQLTEAEKKTIFGLIQELIVETGKVAKVIVKESIQRIVNSL